MATRRRGTQRIPRLGPPFWALLVCLSLTAAAVVTNVLGAKRERDARRDVLVIDIVDRIDNRVGAYIAVLRGVAGLFSTGDEISPEEFHAFASRLRLREYYPGTLGVGFAVRLAPEEVAATVAKVARDRPDFRHWPPGQRDEYTAITLLEPLDERNARALGYDMFSEPTRREAMERARDNAEPALSGVVSLVQETRSRAQPGVILYLPVYRGGLIPATVEERRASLIGYAYAPLRAHDLFEGILGGGEGLALAFAIYDGAEPERHRRLYTLGTMRQAIEQTSRTIAGRTWTLQHAWRVPPPPLWSAWLIAALGGIASALIYQLLRSRDRSRERQLAERALYQTVFDHMPAALAVLDHDGAVVRANPAAAGLLGDATRLPAELDAAASGSLVGALRAGSTAGGAPVFDREIRTARADGERAWRMIAAPLEQGADGASVLLAVDVTERRAAEERAAERERVIQTIADNATLGLLMMDERQQCTFMNRAAEEILGYSLDECRGRALHEVIHHTRPDGTPYPLGECPIDRALPERARMAGEETFVSRDGRFYPVAFTASPILRDGVPVGTVIEVRDLTEEKRIAAEREAERQLLALVTDNLPAVIFYLDRDLVYRFANAALADFLGRPRSEILGRTAPELLGAEAYAEIDPYMRRAFDGDPVQFEIDLVVAGLVRPLRASYQPHRDLSGAVDGIVGLVADISAERAAVAERERLLADELAARTRAERSADELRRLVQVSRALAEAPLEPDAMMAATVRAARDGWTDGCVISLLEDGHLVHELIEGDIHGAWRSALRRTPTAVGDGVTGRVVATNETALVPHVDPAWLERFMPARLTAGPTPFPAHTLVVAPIRGRAGNVLGAISLVRTHDPRPFDDGDARLAEDIALRLGLALEHARLHQATASSLSAAEEVVRFTEVFIGILGHDLRNPLSAVLSGAQFLGSFDFDPAVKRVLGRVESSALRMSRMIDQILDFTRIRLGSGLPIDRRTCDLGVVVRDAIEELISTYGAARIDLMTEGSATGAFDADRMAQVVSNLVGNALQHSADAKVKITVDGRDGERVRLAVSNPGVIPPDLLPVIFDPFRSGRRSSRPQGLGLGLYITERIVTQHDGSIRVESDEDSGTCFIIDLPRRATTRPLPALRYENPDARP